MRQHWATPAGSVLIFTSIDINKVNVILSHDSNICNASHLKGCEQLPLTQKGNQFSLHRITDSLKQYWTYYTISIF
ncbi:hypothetical protein RRG08_049709 [Elysia crispata]|uniref:Uncharacterized protein n=1 Tax=Elysia crispata TaxID=231223 RepID=A0AAE1AHI6_9GAST|nr:hypothetical protein RRG08_049709 [Elysia crispata]